MFTGVLLRGVRYALLFGMASGVFADGSKLFSFGIIADVQAGDKDMKIGRSYREAFDRLDECVIELNRHDLAFTIELGDLIDGGNGAKTALDMERVMTSFGPLSMPLYHVLGNHGKSSVRDMMRQKLNSDVFYYDFTIPEGPGWRFVVLDGNDDGYGVLGNTQLEWLKSKLDQARDAQEKVIVFNHFALLESAAAHHRMQTPDPVSDWINESGCVIAYFAGHDHRGGYAYQDGIHHITVKGMVEAPVDNAYGIIEVYSDRLEEIGFGKEPSREMKYD